MKNDSPKDRVTPFNPKSTTRAVPAPTGAEVLLAAFLMYVKLPVVLYPLALACGSLLEGDDDLLPKVICMLVIGFICCIGIAVVGSMSEGFAIRLRGKVTGAQFGWLRFGGIVLMGLSAVNLFSMIFGDGHSVGWIVLLLRPVTLLTDNTPDLLISAGVFAAGFIWLSTTNDVSREKCACCGGYAYKNETRIEGSYHYELVGKKVETTTEVEDVEFDGYGFDEYIRKTTETTEKYAYSGKKHVVCRHCGKDFGILDDKGTFTEKKKNVDHYSEYH